MLEQRNRLVGRELHFCLPALHRDAAVLGIDAGDHALAPMVAAICAANFVLTVPSSVRTARCPRLFASRLHRAPAARARSSESRRLPGQGSRLAICATSLSYCPAASPHPDRSTAPEDSFENFSIQYSKSSKARRSFSPCTSCTMRPPIRSIDGISMATSRRRRL